MTINIIISHMLPEIVIEIPEVDLKIKRFSPSVLTIFINFLDLVSLPCYEESNDVSMQRMMSAFFAVNLL